MDVVLDIPLQSTNSQWMGANGVGEAQRGGWFRGTPAPTLSAAAPTGIRVGPPPPPHPPLPPDQWQMCHSKSWGDLQGCIGRRGGHPPPPPSGHPTHAQLLSLKRQVPASMAFATDSNRPQPLWQPPPTACLTASGAACEVSSLPIFQYNPGDLLKGWRGGGLGWAIVSTIHRFRFTSC